MTNIKIKISGNRQNFKIIAPLFMLLFVGFIYASGYLKASTGLYIFGLKESEYLLATAVTCFVILTYYYVTIYYYYFRAADEIYTLKDCILIIKKGREEEIKYNEINDVQKNRWWQVKHVKVSFLKNTIFGYSIIFIPKLLVKTDKSNSYTHYDVLELMKNVEKAKRIS